MEAVGASSRTDVLKARVKAEDDRLTLIKTQNAVAFAKANLNYLMGVDVNNDVTVEEISAPESMDIAYEDAVKSAMDNHPLLKKAMFDKKSSQHSITMAKSAIMPQLAGYYGFGTESTDIMDFSDPFKDEFNWYAGVQLSLNIFDGFAAPSNIQRAKIGRQYAHDNLEQVKRDVTVEVKGAYLGLDEAEKSIAAATERVLSAEEDFKLSTARYELGAGTILEQIDAQVALTSARAQKIQAEYDYRFAQSRLKKAIGELK